MPTMRKVNIEMCQILLNQAKSIDEAARLMCESRDISEGFRYWRGQIIKHIELGDLFI